MHDHRVMAPPRQIYASSLNRREHRRRRARARGQRGVAVVALGMLGTVLSVLVAVAPHLT